MSEANLYAMERGNETTIWDEDSESDSTCLSDREEEAIKRQALAYANEAKKPKFPKSQPKKINVKDILVDMPPETCTREEAEEADETPTQRVLILEEAKNIDEESYLKFKEHYKNERAKLCKNLKAKLQLMLIQEKDIPLAMRLAYTNMYEYLNRYN